MLKRRIQKLSGGRIKLIHDLLNLSTLIGALLLVVLIAYYTLRDSTLLANREFQTLQFYICLVFMADAIFEIIIAPNKLQFITTHFLFIIVTLPLTPIILGLNIPITGHWAYFFQMLPMIRAIYILIKTSAYFSKNRVGGLMVGYISLLLVVLLFTSMTVWVDEHLLNPSLSTYWESLWWAVMNTTTTGSSIVPVTSFGRAMEVVLSAMGLVLFPVFTVYLTHIGNNKTN